MPAGDKNGRWKGGTWVNSSRLRDGPRRQGSSDGVVSRVREALSPRVLRDARLPEPGQHAHHINGDKQDDRGENLRWEWPTEHGQLHLTPERARKIGAKGGRATARKRRREQRALQDNETQSSFAAHRGLTVTIKELSWHAWI
jgi:hypothetical protein